MPHGRKSNTSFIICTIFDSSTLAVPNVSILIDVGFATPIAYETCISHLSARLAATIFFATYLAAYAADQSTLDGSLPEKAPPPCLDIPP